MSKANTIALAQVYANNLADIEALERFYDEAVIDLGRFPLLVKVDLSAVTSGVAVYAYPSDAVRIFDILYGTKVLSREMIPSLEVLSRTWRQDTGTPSTWLVEDEERQEYRLYPEPDANSAAFSFPNGAPLGVDYPDDTLVLIYSQEVDDVPSWLEPYLAFEILTAEFNRESNHKDMQFASACKAIAQILLQMVTE